jgi:hypothetical protein
MPTIDVPKNIRSQLHGIPVKDNWEARNHECNIK